MEPVSAPETKGEAQGAASPFAVALLLAGSGMCALVYQTAWLREFRLIFGGSTAASAAVLAIFMGGLGLGGMLLGRRADRSGRPLLFYARLEILIGLSAALSPLLLAIATRCYIATGGVMVLGMPLATAARLVLSALVLGAPTLLMGGTLPAAARAVETSGDPNRRRLALLYGANTIGAVTGALIATFWLLEAIGNRATLLCAASVNLLVGLAAMRISRDVETTTMAGTNAGSSATGTRQIESAKRAGRCGERPLPGADASGCFAPLTAAPRGFVLAAAGGAGFAFFLMEIVWFRMLTPLLGGTTYTFGLILAVALLGIGAGGIAHGLFGGRRPPSVNGFALTCALEAFFIAAPFGLGDRIAVVAMLLRNLGGIGFGGHIIAWTAVTALVAFPASIIAGAQFPMLIALLGPGRDRVGEHTGLAYAWNTAGSIVGSLIGGLVLIPALGAPGAWRATVILLVCLSLAALVLGRNSGRRAGAWVVCWTGVAALILVLAARGPTAMWRHSPIGAGRLSIADPNPNLIRKVIRSQRRTTIWEQDGVESCVGISADSSYSFIVNGKTDGSSRLDAGTQIGLGLLGPLFHPSAREALVIGLGTGSTAGWLAAVPSIQRVDVAELEPAILHVAAVCAPINHDVLANPKVHIMIGDARETLLTTPHRYDLIVSEPSNPYRAGTSSLFTREYYEAARKRLGEGGLFIQWMQGYEVDSQTIQTLYVTLHSVFPNIESWQTELGDLVLIASPQPIRYDTDAIRAALATEPYRSGFEKAWSTAGIEGLFAHYAANSKFAKYLAMESPLPPNTDDLNHMEFSLARNLGMKTGFEMRDLIASAYRHGMGLPEPAGLALNWSGAFSQRPSTFFAERDKGESFPGAGAGEARAETMVTDYAHGDLDELLARWRAGNDPPRDSMETVMIGEALANAPDPQAEEFAARLSPEHPVEAETLIGMLRLRQRRFHEATDAFEAAFLRYRQDPWPPPIFMVHALGAAKVLAREDTSREAAVRIGAAISKPFAVMCINENRIGSAVEIAKFAGAEPYNQYSQEALHAFEPNPAWNRDFLLFRYECYRTLGDPLAKKAEDDLARFAEDEAAPFR